MLLGPEHGLVFVIKCPTPMRCLPQMAPTASHEYLRYLPRVPVLPPTSTYATSYEYLRYLLRVPATNPGLLDFAACSKKHLRYCVVGCFTTTESLSGCHSLPQHDNQVKQWSKRLAVAEFVHVHIPRDNFLQKALCAKDKGHSNVTFGDRFEVH
jgi:hypothetical protein